MIKCSPVYLQTVVNGRALRIVVDDTNGCATVTDRDLGYKSSKCTGDSSVGTNIYTCGGALVILR